ncbi:hypothetical protein GCM10027614_78900 [Micromonospora vulcania]
MRRDVGQRTIPLQPGGKGQQAGGRRDQVRVGAPGEVPPQFEVPFLAAGGQPGMVPNGDGAEQRGEPGDLVIGAPLAAPVPVGRLRQRCLPFGLDGAETGR